MGDELLKTSEARLWALIEERAKARDPASVDERIWDLFGETWAVMFTDLSGFSRRAQSFGILHFLQLIHEQKLLLDPILAAHDGILIKTEADSLLVLFRRTSSAVRCAVAMQHALQRHNHGRKPEEEVLLCVGIGFGPLLRIGNVDVYGQQVNAASKLGEDTAKAHEILVTQAAMESAGEISGVRYEKLDEPVAGSDVNFRVIYAR